MGETGEFPSCLIATSIEMTRPETVERVRPTIISSSIAFDERKSAK